MNRKGFTLVEIMIVVAIIALLAAIAIPNLLRARVSANDSLAQSTLRTLSTAAETFGTANVGNYPANVTALLNATPPYLNENYCSGVAFSGFTYNCAGFTTQGYTLIANPSNAGVTGTSTFTITTGGVLSGVSAVAAPPAE